MEILETLNQNSGAIQAISTTVLVAITGFYAWQTRKTVQEMEKTRKAEFMPILSVKIRADRYNDITIYLQNLGKSLARDPKIYLPLKIDPIEIESISPSLVQSTQAAATVQPDAILDKVPEAERKIYVEYLDVFGQKFITEVPIVAETREDGHGRKDHLTSGLWKFSGPIE